MPRQVLVPALCLVLTLTAVSPSAAVDARDAEAGTPWWLTTALIGGAIGLTMTQDGEIRDWVQDHKTADWETLADWTRPWGEWPVYVTVGTGLTAAGLAVGDDAVRKAGERACLSIAVSALFEGVGKYSFSRRRPTSAEDEFDFAFFDTHSSFPSGHATVAFALSKSLSDDIDRQWATVGLYSIAGISAYVRLIDDMHWASDLIAGAAVGYFSAALVRARILRPDHEGPRFALTPGGPGVAWSY